MEGATLRCRRCRKAVVDSSCSSTVLGEPAAAVCTILHVDVNNLPEWILTSVQQAHWTAGKLTCWFCGARLGGFNFVNHIECPCGCDATVHLNKSRVDQDQKHRIPIVQPRRTRSETEHMISRPAALSDLSPAEASDRLTIGQKRFCLEASGNSMSWFCPADFTSDSSVLNPSGLQFNSEASTDSGVRDLSHHHQADVSLIETRSVHEQDSDSASSLRRFTSDGEAQLEEEEVSSQPGSSSASMKRKKREKNRLKSQRRKQRRRERWLQIHLEEKEATNVFLLSAEVEDRDSLTCAVCLDVYFSPYSCQPCGHVFCEPCLRTLAKNRPTSTPCPLCRALVSNTSFDRDLDQRVKTSFPKVYITQKQNFQNAACARWPLPNSHKRLRSFWDYQRNGAVAWRRWHFAHGGFTPGALIFNSIRDFHFNVDLIILNLPALCCILALNLLCILFYYFVL